MAGFALPRWPGPPPDSGHARPLDAAARAARAFRKLLRDPLPITALLVRLDGPVLLLYATDDPSPMLRMPYSLRFTDTREVLLDQFDEDEDLEDLDDEDFEDLPPPEPVPATVYGLPALGAYLGVAIAGDGDSQEDFLLLAGVARRPPRTRLGGWIANFAELLR